MTLARTASATSISSLMTSLVSISCVGEMTSTSSAGGGSAPCSMYGWIAVRICCWRRSTACGLVPTPSLSATAANVRSAIAEKASSTPSPVIATVSKAGRCSLLRAASISSTVWMSPRSLLLYSRTTGTVSRSRPLATMFCQRFSSDSTFASFWCTCESATNTTPSTPAKTARRVASYCTCPGTV